MLKNINIYRAISALYFLLLFYLTLLSFKRLNSEGYRGTANFKIFDELIHFSSYKPGNRFNIVFDALGNIAIFVPFAMALMVVIRKRLSYFKLIIYGFATTVTIETLQKIFEIGVFDVTDIFLNTAGATIGAVMAKYYLNKR